jgi:hypothetical protein
MQIHGPILVLGDDRRVMPWYQVRATNRPGVPQHRHREPIRRDGPRPSVEA